ncbi:MAG: hypothetical protein JJU13_10300 [Balneolaceae bacterium]|nr:hypothetical protein [Balneolaceae bacterium]
MDLKTECTHVPMFPPELMQSISGLSVYHGVADYLIKTRRLSMENAVVLFQAVSRLDYFCKIVLPPIQNTERPTDPGVLSKLEERLNKLIQDFEGLNIDPEVFTAIESALPHPRTIQLKPQSNERTEIKS